MTVKDVDRGAMALLRRAAKLANRTQFSIGIPANAAPYPDGTPVQVVAAAHEFGLGNVPQRSFIRGWYDDYGQDRFVRDLLRMAQAYVTGESHFSFEFEVQGLANAYVEQMRRRILRHIPPPLQLQTVARKSAKGAELPSTPLADTKHLLDSIVGVVKVR